MTINELIEALEELKDNVGGDIEVKLWEHAGANSALVDITSVNNTTAGVVTLNIDKW